MLNLNKEVKTIGYTAKQLVAIAEAEIGYHEKASNGNKCSYNGKHYVCTIDANTYASDVYRWEEA